MGSIAMQPSGRGYDHGVSTFSPDGRLYQVEYARESVKRGTTTVGLVYKDGVVLIVDKRVQSKLVITDSINNDKKCQLSEKIRVISVSDLLGEAIKIISEESSVSSLFDF